MWKEVCMNRIFLLILLLCLHISNCFSQTYYYQLTKEIRGGRENTNVNGGQFITFQGETCFESDRQGRSVGNGLMKLDRYESKEYKTYSGGCYYGNNALFRFNDDQSLLNIITNAGRVYVYRRRTPPSGATTCSLIKRPEPSVNTVFPTITASPVQAQVTQPSHTPSSTSATGIHSTTGKQPTRKWIDCSMCHGSGRMVYDTHPSTYGINRPDVYCSECGRYWPASFGHSHITCKVCHGKRGYYEDEYR